MPAIKGDFLDLLHIHDAVKCPFLYSIDFLGTSLTAIYQVTSSGYLHEIKILVLIITVLSGFLFHNVNKILPYCIIYNKKPEGNFHPPGDRIFK